jgi:hypothetical protein
MGLLGESWDDPKSQGLLALASGMLQGNMGAGVSNFGQVMANAPDVAMKRKLLAAQISQHEQEFGRKQKEWGLQDQERALAAQFYKAGKPAVMGDEGLPPELRTGAQAMPATEPGYDMKGYASALMGVDPVKGLSVMQALQKENKFGTTPQVGINPQTGKAGSYLAAENGTIKWIDALPRDKLEEVNLGGKIAFRNPYETTVQGGVNKTVSPDTLANNAVTMRGQNMVDARSSADQLKPQWIESLGGFANPKTQEVMPARDMQGNPMAVNKPLTETQGKATTFAARMQDANKVLSTLGDKVDPNQVAQAGYRSEFPSWLPGGQLLGAGLTAANQSLNPMVTDQAQQYRQAQENWVTANLRQESGAAIGKDEMDKDVRKWFPQPGDSESVKRQKEASRQVAARAMVVQAGHGASRLGDIVNGPETGKSIVKTGMYGGKKVIQYSDGSTEYAN